MNHIIGELFRPSLPPVWKEPTGLPPADRKCRHITGVADLLAQCKPDPNHTPTRTRAQQAEGLRRKKRIAREQTFLATKENYRPSTDPKIIGPPSRTLFVGRLKYTLKEGELKEFFSQFGDVDSVRIVRDANEEPRGYGFVLFFSQRSLDNALSQANNGLLKGMRILVDKQRSFSNGWFPMRLGGGIGGRKAPIQSVDEAPSFRGRGATRARGRGAPRGGPRGRGAPRGGSGSFRGGPTRGGPMRSFGGPRGGGSTRGRTPYDRPSGGRGGYDGGSREGGRPGPQPNRYGDRNGNNPRDHVPTHSRYAQDYDSAPRDRAPRVHPRELPPQSTPRESRGGRTLRKY